MADRKVFASKLGLDLSIMAREKVVITSYNQPGHGGIQRIRDDKDRIVRFDTMMEMVRTHRDCVKISSDGPDVTIYTFN